MLRNIADLLKKALILNLVAIPIIFAFWWYVMDQTMNDLSTALITGGLIVMAMGGMFNSSPASSAANFEHQYTRTTSKLDPDQRIRQDIEFHARAYSDAMIFITAGLLCMLSGGGILLLLRTATT